METALTPEEHARGLSFRDGLDPDGGMLFAFAVSEIVPIWMKHVRFPLDVLWIDEKRKIVHMASLEPEGPNGFSEEIPPVAASFVLEIPENEIVRHGFRIGDEVRIR